MRALTCFKAYDVRGRMGVDLDEDIAYRIGRAFAGVLAARTVVLARDVRPSSNALSDAVARGLVAAGCRVLDLGLAGTEEMYCATSVFGADGGICVTASHNPVDYNGLKMVRAGSAPLDAETGLLAIKALAETDVFAAPDAAGEVVETAAEARAAYVARVTEFVDIDALKPLKILVNAGHGTAGPCFDAIAEALDQRGSPLRFERLFHEPDGSFPEGLPNPLLPENRTATARAVTETGADFGVAWDGDFDRCFFFDQEGRFIEGEYIVGLLAQAFLEREPGGTIIHDPRVIWNTCDVIAKAGGHAVQSRTGHAFIKQAMRDVDAVYGGEMSAHHYFRDFFHCDSGMIPWLLIAELVSRHGPLADLVAARRAAFPSSGEINFQIANPREAMGRVYDALAAAAVSMDETDGLSLDMGRWRFNLRCSNTEDLLRLNVEAQADAALVAEGVSRVTAIVLGDGSHSAA
ncbi:phosphomannomutase [Gymnodinialimonas ceratoperidinii]|uniref:Phosphomannomutase n=1 Tax=Gymnodinialimonas ceratoperidinii TaxID=2856823 RepID=A0A8F6TUM9_9RHOB|nr:phosphomannomutase [Gymnodinialimonas ceratoperidinii]QXT39035.1 phosphomannomutase [Gymnodinialimonas ceratoperidinii]